MGIGWGVGYQIFFNLLDPHLKTIRAQFFFWGIFISAWIGAKLLFYLTSPASEPILTSLSFWTGGGFVFYGGFIAALVFILTQKKIWKENFSKVLYPLFPALAFGHGIGRIGCFLAGCCFGKPTHAFWGVFITGEYRHPTQLIEAIGLFIMGLVLIKIPHKRRYFLSIYFIGYGTLRLSVELLRGDSIRGEWNGFPPSLWLSFTLIIVGFLYLRLNKFKHF
jgi:phosphatidylglycerol:prolipoprotein diacylglycerol transferase